MAPVTDRCLSVPGMTVGSAPENPEAQVDELYALDPADFVAARNQLVRRLRKAGNRDLASQVATLRRPSPGAWAVNQLARHHRDELDGLLRLGEALRAAQGRALGGADAADLRDAGRARREAVARLSDLAMGLLVERGTGAEAHHSEVAATLDAASLDAESAQEVASGRLTSALEPPSGFDAFGVDAGPPVSEPAPSIMEDERTEAGAPVAEAKRAASEANRVAADRAADARDAVALAERRHREVDQAEAKLERVQRVLDDARRRADEAHRDADAAVQAAAVAREAAAQAAERLRQAEQG